MKIVIPLIPVTKKNSQQIIQVHGRPMIIPSKKYKQYERDCGPFLPAHGINGPVNIKAVYYMPTRRRVDLCNLHEALCDVLVKHGVITDDNSLIVASMDGSRVLYDKDNPRTEVYIDPVETPQLSG